MADWVIYSAIFLVYLGIIGRFFFKHLGPFPRRLLVGLIGIEVLLVAWFALRTDAWSPFMKWYSDLAQGERNPAATFASIQLMLIALSALYNLLWSAPGRWWHRLFMFLLLATFVYLAADEYFLLHEGHSIKGYIAIGGIALAASGVAVYWFGYGRRETRFMLLILGGLVLMGTGGIALEKFAGWNCLDLVPNSLCRKLPPTEEILELLGATTVLIGLVDYAHRNPLLSRWRRAILLPVTGGAVWGAWLVASFWFVPALESRLLPNPIGIDYQDGAFSLVGYAISDEVLEPGDSISVIVYLRANESVPQDFGVSIHLVSRADAQSVFQLDENINLPETSLWPPGLVGKKSLTVAVPEDIALPGSYRIAFTLWEDGSFAPQAATSTDLELLSPESAILATLPAISPDMTLSRPPTEVSYTFSDGFSLIGYAAPESVVAGEEMSLRFWWETQAAVDSQLVQFIHLFAVNGEDFASFDRQPFDGAFPTQDWPGGIEVMDEWTLTLPDDLPPGEYRLHTGLYDATTADRTPVTDADGQPVQDQSIVLDTISLRE